MHCILLADDDVDLLELMTHRLKYLGYDVETVESGEEVLARFESGRHFDVVITDNSMLPQGKRGIDVLRLLKADSRYKDLPIIVHSGDKGIVSTVEELGGVFVEKTTSPGFGPLMTALDLLQK